VLAACTSGDATQLATSTMFRSEPAHRGTAPPLFSGQGGVRWRFQTGGTVRSTPAVTADRVYAGSGDGFLYAINRNDGTLAWRFDAGNPVHASPAVSGDLVVAATLAGRIFAVDETTGALRWSLTSGTLLPLNTRPAGGWDIFVSSPTVVGDTVFIGSPDGNLYALQLASGNQIWKAATGGRLRATPSVSNDLVVVGSWNGRVYAFDRRTGAERWVHRTEGDTLDSRKFGYDRRAIQSSAAIVDGSVFLGSRDDGVYALDLATGARKWRVSHGGSWVIGSPAAGDGRVYAGSSDAHFVQALDAATGGELWHQPTGANVLASPVLAGNNLVIATYRTDAPIGELRVLDPATGSERWRLRLDGSSVSTPVVTTDGVYLGTDGGSIYAISQTQPVIPRLAVYFDSSLASQAFVPGSRLAFEHFRDQGYQPLNAAELARFFTERIADQVPSVVVFAIDAVPASVAPVMADSVLFVRYLRAGGKVVWLGAPPGSLVFDSAGKLAGTEDFKRTQSLLGISTASMDFNELGGHPTAVGREWGIAGWHRGDFPIDQEAVSLPLSVDEAGQANAWVKTYRADRPWAGLVQLWGFGATVDRLPDIQAAAEYGLLRTYRGSRP
jgi:outer membrane protein assembly factor BamB